MRNIPNLTRSKKFLLSILVTTLLVSSNAFSANMMGRLGIGMSKHLDSGMNSVSLKLQRNRSTAIGGSFGLDSGSSGTFYALGIKMYRLIYEEPQLNFYSAIAGDIWSYASATGDTEQAYQGVATFGSEFSFQGLESIGFSFEFGMSLGQVGGETRIKTVGLNVIQSAVHFYL